MLRRTPGFTATSLFTIALGIGANSAIFSVASGVLLRPLPYPAPERLAMVWMDNARIALREDWHSFPDYTDYRTRSQTFEDMAIFNGTSRTLTGDGNPERVLGAHSSPNLFDVLGVRPIHGRVYSVSEDTPETNNVVVLSHGLWQRRFGGRPEAIGGTVQMNGRAMQIVGVMPDGFAFPSRETQFWVPTGASEQQRNNRGSLWLQIIGRLKPGVSIEQGQGDLARVSGDLLAQFPNRKGYGIYVAGYREQVIGRVRPAILVLLGAVACVLLIACTNVANLLLARASVRERELALRAAIGAGRGRLVRQLLTESLLLGAAGGALGIALAWGGLAALLQAAPADLPRRDAIVMDWRVLLFSVGLSLLTGLLFGLAPALQLARTDPGQTMKEGARGTSALGRSLRRGLVVVEIALAVVLLVGAGLMLRSFDRMRSVDLGFRPEHVLTARVALWGEAYRQPATRAAFFRQLIERIEAQPGVQAAGSVGTVFLSATPNSTNFSIEGRPDFPPEEAVEVPVDAITPNYFRVMGVPLREGRFFEIGDADGAPPAVIINETMARRFWPNGTCLGPADQVRPAQFRGALDVHRRRRRRHATNGVRRRRPSGDVPSARAVARQRPDARHPYGGRSGGVHPVTAWGGEGDRRQHRRAGHAAHRHAARGHVVATPLEHAAAHHLRGRGGASRGGRHLRRDRVLRRATDARAGRARRAWCASEPHSAFDRDRGALAGRHWTGARARCGARVRPIDDVAPLRGERHRSADVRQHRRGRDPHGGAGQRYSGDARRACRSRPSPAKRVGAPTAHRRLGEGGCDFSGPRANHVSVNGPDQASFEALLTRHRGIIFKVANTFCRDTEDRRDLAQEICTQLWRAYPSFDEARSFSTWMYRIALNVAISHRRLALRRGRHVFSLDDAALAAIPDPAHEADDRIRELYRVIHQLDDLNRALMLLYLEGHDYREIADVLGITETNVATKLNRLKQRLRSEVAVLQA